MLDSNDALVTQFIERGRESDAQFYASTMIYDAYFTMNKDEWLNQENMDYRHSAECRFRDYWLKYKHLHDSLPQNIRAQVIIGVKNRKYTEGLLLETQTFAEWIKQIESMEVCK